VPRVEDYSPSHIDAVREFLFNPNANDETFAQLLSKVLVDLLVTDVAAIEKVRSLRGNLVEIWARDATTFTVLIDEHGVVTGYRQDVAGREKVTFGPNDVIFLVLHPQTDSAYGKPILESVIDEVATYLFTNSYIARSFTEDEIPPGILSVGPIGEEAVKQLKADFEAGRTNRYRLRVIWDPERRPDADWIELRRPNREMQLDELRQSIERIIFRAFGLTPLEAGIASEVNRSTALMQRTVAEKRRIVPIIRMLEYYINTEIVWSEFGYTDVAFKFDFELTRDVEAEARAYERYVKSGIMSRNEVRSKMNLPPVPGGDGYVMVSGGNVVPLPAQTFKPEPEVTREPIESDEV